MGINDFLPSKIICLHLNHTIHKLYGVSFHLQILFDNQYIYRRLGQTYSNAMPNA